MPVQAIDTRKLRRFIAERNRHGEEVRRATDAYLHVRDEAAKLEAFVAGAKAGGQEPNPQNEQRLQDLREDKAELERQRDLAAQRFEEWSFVDDLVEYARNLGYQIDTASGTVTKPVRDNRAPAPDRMGQNGPKRSYVYDTTGVPGTGAGASPVDTSAPAYTGGQ